MKKQQSLLVILMFLSISIYGQKTEKEIEQEAVKAVQGWFENPSFDNTSQLDLSIMDELQDSGRLENGLREGEWIIYDIDSSQIGNTVDVNVNDEKHIMRLDPSIEKHVGIYRVDKKEGTWIKYESLNYKPPFRWTKKIESDYQNGMKHGKEIFFQGFSNDKLDTLAVMYYNYGIETGEGRVYNYNYPYKLKEVYSLTNDGQSFLSAKYYDDGRLQIKYIDTIINNKFYFCFSEYYSNGFLKSTGFFNKNNIDSTYKEYHTNGQPSIEKEYRDGKLWNVTSIKTPRGKNKKIGDFKNGNGSLNVYDEKGNKIKTIEYIEGIEQQNE